MKYLISSFLLTLVVATLPAATIFVTEDGNDAQAGDSWQAAVSLQKAAIMAKAGDQIWITSGHYLPGSERTSSFHFAPGVAVFGGFDGTEMRVNDRKATNAPTILSGDIGEADNPKDNVYTVVFLENATATTSLDRLTISGGAAKGYDDNLLPITAGAALYITGSPSGQGPMITNCTFENNAARYGGAVFIDGSENAASPVFTNCVFAANKADFLGGAVYNNGQHGAANPIFRSCRFESNTSDYGAGILNDGTAGESSPLIIGCQFIDNYSISTGAVVYNLKKGTNGHTNPILENCELIGNGSVLGGDVAETPSPIVQSSHNGGRLTPVLSSSETQN